MEVKKSLKGSQGLILTVLFLSVLPSSAAILYLSRGQERMGRGIRRDGRTTEEMDEGKERRKKTWMKRGKRHKER